MNTDIQIDTEAGGGRRDQIYRQLRAAILDGRLTDGEPLPPTRELARRLSVSRNTVSSAYDLLAAEGFLLARTGAGTFVRAGAARQQRPHSEPRARLMVNEVWDVLPPAPAAFETSFEFDFRAGIPDLARFPFDTWRRLSSEQLRASNADVLTYGEPAGDPALRAAITRHVSVSRGLTVDPDDVVVTNGAQQAFDLVARVLLRPGDTVAVEDPGYPAPRLIFATHGMRVAGVPVDSEGIVVDAIPADARLVFVTPSHQCPLGMAMSLERRLELIAWARRVDGVIVEDDYDSEFRYGGRPLEPVHSLDDDGRVCYVSSFSKLLFPALRLGFLIVPASVRAPVRKAKQLTDWHSDGPAQATLARFMADGGFARHVKRMRRAYHERHDLVTEILHAEFDGMLSPVPSAAGLHVSALGEAGEAFVREVRAAGIRLYTVESMAVGKPAVTGLIFGYGAIPAERIGPGMRRVRDLLRKRG